MTFIVRKLKFRPWPVTVAQQDCAADGTVTQTESTFVGHFAPFTEEQFQALADAGDAAYPVPPKVDGEPKKSRDMKDMLARNALIYAGLLVGWGAEVRDEGDQPLPFSAEALTALIVGPDGLAISTGLNKALDEIRFGMAPAKNLPTSPAPGPAPAAVEAAPASTS